MSNLTEIRPVGTKMSHAHGQTDMTKLTVAFCNFASSPKNTYLQNTELKMGSYHIMGGGRGKGLICVGKILTKNINHRNTASVV
jgi:hypothetical protein